MSINSNNNNNISSITSIEGYHKFNLLAKNLKANSQPKTIQSVHDVLLLMETKSIGTKFAKDVAQLKTEFLAFKEVIEKGDSTQNITGKLEAFQKTVNAVYKTAVSAISKTVSQENAVTQPSTVTSSSNEIDVSIDSYLAEVDTCHKECMQELLIAYPITCFSLLDMFESIRNGKYGNEAQTALQDSSTVYFDLPSVLKLTLIHYCYTNKEFSVPDILPKEQKANFEKFFKFIMDFEKENVFKLVSGDSITLDKTQNSNSKEEITDDNSVALLNNCVSAIMSSLMVDSNHQKQKSREKQTALVKMPFIANRAFMRNEHSLFAFVLMTIQGNNDRANEILSHLPPAIQETALTHRINILLSLKKYQEVFITLKNISENKLKANLLDYFIKRLFDNELFDQLSLAISFINLENFPEEDATLLENNCISNCRNFISHYFRINQFALGTTILANLPNSCEPIKLLQKEVSSKLSLRKVDFIIDDINAWLEMLRIIKMNVGNAKELYFAAESLVSNAIADLIDDINPKTSLLILSKIPNQEIRRNSQTKIKESLLSKRLEIDLACRKMGEAVQGKLNMEATGETKPYHIFKSLKELMLIPYILISPGEKVKILQESIENLGPNIRNQIYGSVYQQWYHSIPSNLRIELDKDHNFGFNACYTVSEQSCGFPKLIKAIEKLLNNG